jgi:hypothetical protein
VERQLAETVVRTTALSALGNFQKNVIVSAPAIEPSPGTDIYSNIEFGARLEAPQAKTLCSLLVPLIANCLAVTIQFPIELCLLALGDVASMRSLVSFELTLDPGIAASVPRSLPRRKLSLVDALVDPVFLIVDTPLNLVYAWMAGVILRKTRRRKKCA